MRFLLVAALLAVGCVTGEDHPELGVDQRGDVPHDVVSGAGGFTGAGGAAAPDGGTATVDTGPAQVCPNPYPYGWDLTMCADGKTGLCNVSSNSGVVIQSYLAYAGCAIDSRIAGGAGGVLCVAACP